MIKIREEYCPKNHKCSATFRCPVGAIKQKKCVFRTDDRQRTLYRLRNMHTSV